MSPVGMVGHMGGATWENQDRCYGESLEGARGQAHSPLSCSRDHKCSELGLSWEPLCVAGKGLGLGSWRVR